MSLEANALFACNELSVLERLPSDAVTLVYLNPPWNIRSNVQWEGDKPIELADEQYADYISKLAQQVYRILNSSGSLFVHWSPVSPFDVRLVINQAFGAQPRYEIIWHKRGLLSHTKDSRVPRVDSEFILVYSKSDEPIYNPVVRPLSPEEASRYAQKDERGSYMLADLTLPFERSETHFIWHGCQLPARRSWRFTLNKMEALFQENRVYFPPSAGLPRLKRYLDEHSGVELGTMWNDIPAIAHEHQRTGYFDEKPLALMERIIQLASNTGDLVLDPFCGAGTALSAAQSFGRRWWGVASSAEAHQITVERLLTTYGLEAGDAYVVHSEADVSERPIVDAAYRNLIVSIDELAHLQQQVSLLTSHLLSLKKLMNIGESDDEGKVEALIEQMEHWISVSVTNQPQSMESYIAGVCSWLSDWDRLNESSQIFLPQAELLFHNITHTNGQDYSPCIIQYCRTLENELLTKLFAVYTDDLHDRSENISEFLAADLENDKTGRFAKLLQERRNTYTLGDMAFIMSLMKANGQTLERSALLQDFRRFTVQQFSEHITETAYLEQINRINKDFRCRAAHPYILNSDAAQGCRNLLQTCLNELLQNYRVS